MKDGFSQFKELEKQLFGQKSSRKNMCKLFGISSSTYFKMQREDKLNAKVLAHCKTLNTMPVGLLNVVAQNHGIELNE